MSAYNYSSAALVIVVGLLPLCLVVRFIGMVYLSDCQKPYPDETGHRDGEELLTPLSIISASVDELKQEVPASSSVCSVIADNTVRLIRLIQQILEFRKVENGKLRLKVSHGNVSMFLKKSVSAFAPLVKKQKLSIQFDLSEEYSGYFDVDKLDKVVYNLLNILLKEELLWCRRLMMRKRGLLN